MSYMPSVIFVDHIFFSVLYKGKLSSICQNHENVDLRRDSYLITQSCPTLCNLVDCVAHQAPLSMGFFRQKYWSGLPFPPKRDLPDPGT